MTKNIAIDAMGGDLAPESVIRGLSLIESRLFHFIIFGDKSKIDKYLELIPKDLSYEIRHTDVQIESDMDLRSGLKIGNKSSMGMAIDSVKSGESEAVISSGNTGLYMALSKLILKTINGIDRPAIASLMPGKKGRSIFLDLGANAECDVKNLIDFAIMGEAVARSVFSKNDVKIALLNIGSEQIKGSALVKKASGILSNIFENYVGYVEGDDICNGDVDVIVTDGFTGNVTLKAIEGVAKYIVTELKNEFKSSLLAKLGACLSIGALKSFKNRMDPRLYNGAILVGLNGVVVKSHGNSDAVGFANAVNFTIKILRDDIFTHISNNMKKSLSHIEVTKKDINE